MPVPNGINMDSINAAMARRNMGGGQPMMPGGGAAPAVAQVTPPSGAIPTGQPNTPTPAPAPQPGTPPPGGEQVPPRKAAAGMARVGQVAQGPNFDEQTKGIAKALVTKLLQYI